MPKFPKTARLRCSQDYKATFDHGVKLVLPSLVLFAANAPYCEKRPILGSQQEPQELRLGIVVSKKVGNAVIRNRCKRLLRACFAQRFRDLLAIFETARRMNPAPFQCPLNLVIVVRSYQKLGNFGELERRLLEHFPRLIAKLMTQSQTLIFQSQNGPTVRQKEEL